MSTVMLESPRIAPAAARAAWTGTIDDARNEVFASASGGAPFLLAFGTTLGACALLGVFLPVATAAIVLFFQGNVALPLAFWLEPRLTRARMSRSNPLRELSIQLAMSQVLALPAAFIAYSHHPALVPAALAAIAGAHFLPYAWLHRTRVYSVLAVAVSAGGFALTYVLRSGSFTWVCLFMSLAYFVAAAVLLRRSRAVQPAG